MESKVISLTEYRIQRAKREQERDPLKSYMKVKVKNRKDEKAWSLMTFTQKFLTFMPYQPAPPDAELIEFKSDKQEHFKDEGSKDDDQP